MISPIESETIAKVRSELGLTEKSIKSGVKELQKWLKSQPHLPKECDEEVLERWLIRGRNDMEQIKTLIDMYYTVRTAAPEILSERDPSSDWFKQAVKKGYCCFLPQLTPDCDRVTVIGCTDSDATDYNAVHMVKMIFMAIDLRLSQDYNISEIVIIDFGNIAFGHVTQVSLPMVKKYETCGLKGLGLKVKAIHVINMPSFANVILTMLKKVLPSDLEDKIYVHAKDSTTLSEHIPVTMLPKDYGGEGKTLEETWATCIEEMSSNQSWYLKEDKQKSNERRRPGGPVDSGELFSFGVMKGIRRLASNLATPVSDNAQADMPFMF